MDHPGTGRKVESEVVPVLPHQIPPLWPDVRRMLFWQEGGALDPEALHQRLLLGRDRLWLGLYTRTPYYSPYACVIVTSLSERPPHKKFQIEKGRCLTVHLVNGYAIESWIWSAVERIGEYARAQNVNQIFVLSRKGWAQYALRFFRDFEHVYYARDRQARAGRKMKNTPGRFRTVAMAPPERDRPENRRYQPYLCGSNWAYVRRGIYESWPKGAPECPPLPTT